MKKFKVSLIAVLGMFSFLLLFFSGQAYADAIAPVNDDFNSPAIMSATGGFVGDVTANDILNGAPLVDADITITINFDGGSGASIDSNGNLSIPVGLANNTYHVQYRICEDANASNCAIASASFVVDIDTDGDGIPNLQDTDDDNDGILDVDEICDLYEESKKSGVCGLFDLPADQNAFLPPLTPAAGCNAWSQNAFTPDIVEPYVGFVNGAGIPRWHDVVPSPQGGNFLGVASDLTSHEIVEVNVSNLAIGETYKISFLYANVGRTELERDDVTVQVTLPDGAGTIVNTQTISYDPTTWYTYSTTFVATATSSTMLIGANALNDTLESAAGVDRVSITLATCGDANGDGIPDEMQTTGSLATDNLNILINEYGPTVIDVLGNGDNWGSNGPGTQVITFTQPTYGVVILDDGSTPNDPTDDVLIYTPDPDHSDIIDSFTYTITDALGNTSTATVTLNLNCVTSQSSDSGDALSLMSMLLLAIMTAMIGLYFVRKEEERGEA